jgi:putative PIN family toxin of toxin-antitoxin system
MKAVVDSNVWLSAALSPDGTPAQVLRNLLLNGEVIFSDATFNELETRIWRPKFDRYISLETRRSILRDIKGAAHWVSIPAEMTAQAYCRDPDDDVFIHTALAAQAPCLISGDKDLLAVPQISGLSIVSPAQALVLLAALQ